MKNITFKRLSMANFLSIGKEVILDFKEGINVITGVNLDKDGDGNGVGKSTILCGLFYAIFGETLKDLKKEQIVNNIAKKNCIVRLEFDVEQNGVLSKIRVERGIAPSFCRVFVNDSEDKTLSTIPATNNYIINLINSTTTVFKNTVTTGINNTVAFMHQKKNERRSFIEGILRLELFNVMKKVTNDVSSSIYQQYETTLKQHDDINNNIKIYTEKKQLFEDNRKSRINDITKRKIDYCNQLAEMKNRIIDVTENIYKSDYLRLDSEVKGLSDSINAANISIATLSSRLKTNTDNIQLLTTKYNTYTDQKTKCDDYQTLFNTKEECLEKIKSINTDIESMVRLFISAEKDIDVLKKEILTIKQQGSFCDKCKRPFPENDVKMNEEKISNNNESIKKMQEDMVKYNNTISENKKMILNIEQTIKVLTTKNEINDRMSDVTNQINLITQENTTLNDKIATIQEKLNGFKDKYQKLYTDFTTQKMLMDELDKKISNNKIITTMIKSLDSDILTCDSDVKHYEQQNNEFETLLNTNILKQSEIVNMIESYKERIAIYDVIKYVISDEGAKSFIIKKLLGILNERINYYLTKLDANCQLTFNEFFEDTIINDRNVECVYDNFSGGERKRIDLACLFAFMDLRRIQGDVKFNLTFFDELLDSAISANCSEKLFQVLKERYDQNNESCYIITHRKENIKNPLINNVVRLEKVGGITRLAKENVTD